MVPKYSLFKQRASKKLYLLLKTFSPVYIVFIRVLLLKVFFSKILVPTVNVFVLYFLRFVSWEYFIYSLLIFLEGIFGDLLDHTVIKWHPVFIVIQYVHGFENRNILNCK